MASYFVFTYLIALISSQASYDPPTFWKHDLRNYWGMGVSGDAGYSYSSYCPNGTPCQRLRQNGAIWISTPRPTTGYNQITVDVYMRVVDAENGEYCTVSYSIDDSYDWTIAQKYSNSNGRRIFELPSNASDNSLGIRLKFSMEGNSVNDACYISTGHLYGTEIVPTSQPTVFPTQTPSGIPSADPSAFRTTLPSSNPTSVPTMIPSNIPTENPSENPTLVPTQSQLEVLQTSVPTKFPTTNPTVHPSVYPTYEPTRNPLTNSQMPTASQYSDELKIAVEFTTSMNPTRRYMLS